MWIIFIGVFRCHCMEWYKPIENRFKTISYSALLMVISPLHTFINRTSWYPGWSTNSYCQKWTTWLTKVSPRIGCIRKRRIKGNNRTTESKSMRIQSLTWTATCAQPHLLSFIERWSLIYFWWNLRIYSPKARLLRLPTGATAVRFRLCGSFWRR